MTEMLNLGRKPEFIIVTQPESTSPPNYAIVTIKNRAVPRYYYRIITINLQWYPD